MPTKPLPWDLVNLVALILFISFNALIRIKENQISDDTRMQFASAQAWRQGYGVSILYADPNDLAKVTPRRVEFWPPGYAVFAGLFLQLTGDVQLSCFLVDILGLILFFIGWFLMARRLIPFTVPYFPALLMLPWAFGFMFKWIPTTDLIAMAWYVLGMAFLIQWVASTESRFKVGWLIACALAVFGACFFRFAYYPLAFVPAGILLAGALFGNRSWWRAGFLLLALTVVLVGGQVLYQQLVAGSMNYLSQRHQGSGSTIHWYNLEQFTPFVTRSIPGASLLPFSEPVSDILLILVLLIGSILVAWATKRLNEKARRVIYIWLGATWLAFLLNVAFMVFLSLRYPPESWGPWTYVQEIRYFALNMAITSAVLIFLLFWKGSPLPKYVRYGLYAVSIVVFAHSYAFGSFKKWVHESITPSEPLQTAAVVHRLVRENPGRVVFASDQVHNYWGNVPVTSMGMFGAMGGASIIHVEPLMKSHHCSKPVTVLVAIVHALPAGLDEFYRECKARQVGTVGEGIPLMQLSLPVTTAHSTTHRH